MPVVSKPFGGIPSHPPVRHYDRSELMKLTNLRCGKATPERVPSPHQGLPLPLSQRLERVQIRAKSGSLDRIVRAGGAARRSFPTPNQRQNGAPRPSRGRKHPSTRRGSACGLSVFSRAKGDSLCLNRATDPHLAPPTPSRSASRPSPRGGGYKARLISIIYAIRQLLLSPSWGEMREWGARHLCRLAPLQPRSRSAPRAPHTVSLREPTLPTRGRV